MASLHALESVDETPRVIAGAPETIAAVPQEAARALRGGVGSFEMLARLAQRGVVLLKPSELRECLGFGQTKFWRLQKAGTFDKLRADVDGERLYSWPKVWLWLTRDRQEDRAAGRRNESSTSRRFLGAARRERKRATNHANERSNR